MDDDLFSHDYEPRPPRGDNLFLWTVFILLLIGFAFACWLGSFYIFGHPENPRSYKILQKLKKIEQPRRFELTAAPPGEFLTPQKIYDRYATFTPLQLKNENDELMRNYINNYQITKKLIPYVAGRFTILDSYELKSGDLFYPGVAALAQSVDFPQMLIEHVYTSDAKNVPMLQKMLMTGLEIKLEKSLDLAAVIHIEKLQDGRMQLTVVPLLYGSYALKQGSGGFSLEPPTGLNLDAGAPIIRTTSLQEAFKAFQTSQGKPAATQKFAEKVAVAVPAQVGAPTPKPALVGPEHTPAAPAPAPTAPVAAASVPAPEPPEPEQAPTPPRKVASSTPRPSATQKRPPQKIAVAIPTPPPVAVSSEDVPLQPFLASSSSPGKSSRSSTTPAPKQPLPAASTSPTPVSPLGVPLQPFLAAAPAPNATPAPGGSWRTYPPGQIPPGRQVEPPDVNQLVDRNMGSERIYLRGSFVVTASGGNRAVLRSHSSLALGNLIKGGSGSIRIIVDYPVGTVPPAEGASFSRDESRPFQISEIRRGNDGNINVYVREITAP